MTNTYEFQPRTTVSPSPDGVHYGDCRKQRDGGDWCHCYDHELVGAGWHKTGDIDDPQAVVWHEAERCEACLVDEKYVAYQQRVQEAYAKIAEAAFLWCEEDIDETRRAVQNAVDSCYQVMSQPLTAFLDSPMGKQVTATAEKRGGLTFLISEEDR